jgi:hypothetical protein
MDKNPMIHICQSHPENNGYNEKLLALSGGNRIGSNESAQSIVQIPSATLVIQCFRMLRKKG